MNSAHEFAVGAGIIRPPAPALPRKKCRAAELGGYKRIDRLWHRRLAKAEIAAESAAATVAVFGVDQAGEVELRWVVGIRQNVDRQTDGDQAGQTQAQYEGCLHCGIHFIECDRFM